MVLEIQFGNGAKIILKSCDNLVKQNDVLLFLMEMTRKSTWTIWQWECNVLLLHQVLFK
jgi:hypothetical protein